MATSAEIAQLIADQGRLAAEGRRRVGQIYGNLFSNIGTTIGNIPAQLQEQKILQANAAIRNQQMQIGQFQLQSAQRAQMGQQVLAKAIQQYPDDPKAVAREVSKFSPELGTEYLKGQSDLATHAANLDELNRKRLAADSALLGDAAFQSEQSSDPSTAFTARLAAFKDRLSPETLKQLQKVQTPEDAEAFRKARIQDSPLWQEQQKERTKIREVGPNVTVGSIAEGPMMKGAAPPPKTKAEYAADMNNPTSPTREQSRQAFDALEAVERGNAERAAATAAEGARHNRRMEDLSAARLGVMRAQANGEGLTPEAIDYAASAYRLLGTRGMPTRLSGPDREKIMNAAATQSKAMSQSPADVVTKQLTVKADSNALNTVQKLQSTALGYESKALGQSDIINEVSPKVPRTRSPIINEGIQKWRERVTGDENATKLANAITTFSAEYAKIMEGSTGSVSGSSDAARRAADRLVNTGMSQKTLSAVLEQMKREMRLTIQGYDVAKQDITGRIGGGSNQSATPQLRYNPATGKTEPIK